MMQSSPFGIDWFGSINRFSCSGELGMRKFRNVVFFKKKKRQKIKN